MEQVTMQNFWHHPFIKNLQPGGKLVMAYALCCQENDMPVIAEDAALLTGIEVSAVGDYLELFDKKQLLGTAEILDSAL